jgi:hypothetical protein
MNKRLRAAVLYTVLALLVILMLWLGHHALLYLANEAPR